MHVEAGADRHRPDDAPHHPHEVDVGRRAALGDQCAVQRQVDRIPLATAKAAFDVGQEAFEQRFLHRPAGIRGSRAQQMHVPFRIVPGEVLDGAELGRRAGE